METDAFYALNEPALRLYVIVCYIVGRTRLDHCRFTVDELTDSLSCTSEQIIEAANQIKATELLTVSIRPDTIEFRI